MNPLLNSAAGRVLTTLAVFLLLAPLSVQAATLYWDADGNTANNDCATGAGLGGTNSWNLSASRWTADECDNLTPSVPWTDLNDAVFGGTKGIVTLAANRTVGNLTFKTGGYEITAKALRLDAAGGGNITNLAGTTTISSIFDGSNGYAKHGSGTLLLENEANTISGPVYVYEGVLRMVNYLAMGANHVGQTITVDGGTLRNDSSSVGGYFLSRNVTLYVGTNNATITPNNANGILLYSNNILGVVEGQGVLTKQGAGEIRIFGPSVAHNTYGKLVIATGIFTAGHSTYPGYADTFCRIPETNTADAITIKNGAQMRLVGSANVTLNANQGITILSGGGVIAALSGRTLTIPSSITAGNNWLEFNDGDTGTVSLRGANEMGPVTNSSGVLLVRNSDALGDTNSGTTVLSGSSLAVSTTVNVPEPLLLFGTGMASSTGALRNNGNNNIWSGPITLGESGVRIDSEQATLTLAGGVSGEGDLDLLIGGDGNVTIETSAIILGAGTLTKDGAGTLILATTNVIGGVVVNAGTLLVNNTEGSATGSGSVTVVSGATLGGNGRVDGAATIDGTLAPGASIGTLTLGASPTLNGTILLEIDPSQSPNADKLVVADKPLILAGTLTVNNLGPELAGGEQFDLFDAQSLSGELSATNLPTLATGLNWWTGRLMTEGKLVVNRAPTADHAAYARELGTSLKIKISDLLMLCSDPDQADGDSVELQAVNSGEQGATVIMGTDYIFYAPANGNDDTLVYTVRDQRGGSSQGSLSITVQNAAGSARPPEFLPNGSAVVNLAGVPGYPYEAQRATDIGFTVGLRTWITNAPPHGVFQIVDDFSDLGEQPPSAWYKLKYNP